MPSNGFSETPIPATRKRDGSPSTPRGDQSPEGSDGAHLAAKEVPASPRSRSRAQTDAFAMVDAYRHDFDRLVEPVATEPRGVRADAPTLFNDVRRASIRRFGEIGFPSTRDEAWRFTNVGPIAAIHFVPAPASLTVATEAALHAAVDEHSLPGTWRLVFVDGRSRPDLSQLVEDVTPDQAGAPSSQMSRHKAGSAPLGGPKAAMPPGAIAGSLRQACDDGHPAAASHLGRTVPADQPFAALGGAFAVDGAFIFLPEGAVLEQPVHILHLTTATDRPSLVSPRTLVVADARSAATVIETYAGISPSDRFEVEGGSSGDRRLVLPVTEIIAGDESSLIHIKLQHESPDTSHLASLNLTLGRASHVACHNIDLGGRLVRNDLSAVLDGEGAEATLDGLYVLAGDQHVDNHMRVEHAKAHTSSREVYKGVLDGESRAVFNGLIYVHPGADQTDAKQSNRNLILSDTALVNSNPQLEIFASDVKCTHGSTVGQLDEDALFYFRSRGIGAAEARRLLVTAFAGEIVDQIPVEAIRVRLEGLLAARLRGER